MATEIRIPKLGMSATEMTLLEWMFVFFFNVTEC